MFVCFIFIFVFFFPNCFLGSTKELFDGEHYDSLFFRIGVDDDAVVVSELNHNNWLELEANEGMDEFGDSINTHILAVNRWICQNVYRFRFARVCSQRKFQNYRAHNQFFFFFLRKAIYCSLIWFIYFEDSGRLTQLVSFSCCSFFIRTFGRAFSIHLQCDQFRAVYTSVLSASLLCRIVSRLIFKHKNKHRVTVDMGNAREDKTSPRIIYTRCHIVGCFVGTYLGSSD